MGEREKEGKKERKRERGRDRKKERVREINITRYFLILNNPRRQGQL